MKRFHVHVGVSDLASSIRFYSALFGAEPSVRKDDYAKWMLDDPRVNFAISARRNGHHGVNHLGVQAESPEELAALREGFVRADAQSTVAETNVACCYARSDKHWVRDPQGIAWEAFHTLDTIPVYDGRELESIGEKTSCCAPASGSSNSTAACCAPAVATASVCC